MDRVRRRFCGRLRLLSVGLIVAAAIGGCGGTNAGIHPARTITLRYADPQGWTLRYSSSLSLEQSTSGPAVTFTEVTIANFAQQRAVISGKTRDGGFIRVLAAA